MNYQTCKAKLDRAESTLAKWGKACDDKRKFYPVMKAEWDRAFDNREAAKFAACRSDPKQFAADYPGAAWLVTYLALATVTDAALDA